MSLMTQAARWLTSRAKLQGDTLPTVEAKLARKLAVQPTSDDPSDHAEWRRQVRDLEDEVAAVRDALVYATAQAAAAEAEQEALDGASKHAAEVKQAKADEKLLAEYEATALKLAGIRDRIAASVARTTEVNANRGESPFILDAETRVRQRMTEGRPAITEKRRVWVDASGEVVAPLTSDREGRQMKNPNAIEQVERTFTICAETPAVAVMPTRLADAIKLVDLDGKSL